MKSKTVNCIVVLLLLVAPAFSQEWKREEKTDPLRGTNYFEFVLAGKYLTPPKKESNDAKPLMVVRCIPEPHEVGQRHAKGIFKEGFIYVGGPGETYTYIDAYRGAVTSVRVQYRVDDGKLQEGDWNRSDDDATIYFSNSAWGGSGWKQFANLLYGRRDYQKEKTSSQVHKVVITVTEAVEGEVVMQFDMPEAAVVADACGVISYKEKQ
jgi:hypothetical protein